jgi:rubrerythrin
MPTIADVLRRYGGQYLERFGATMPGEHKKVLHAITACRTGEFGTVLYVCQSCGEIHAIGRSCGNRHCPTCQHEKTKAWFAAHNAVGLAGESPVVGIDCLPT